jgi:excisionase family DNA binding protein
LTPHALSIRLETGSLRHYEAKARQIAMEKTLIEQNVGKTYASVAALAQDLGMCERSTRDALRRREIPHIRIGKRYILPRAAIEEWLRNAGRIGGRL